MRLLKLLVVLALFISLAVTVFAHPGKTDSSGGHTDHSTGEYHYHHGHSAHQHYDQDGDGNLDCPYDFKDMTGINSGESSITETYVEKIDLTKDETKESTKKARLTEDTILTFCLVLLGFGILVDAIKYGIDEIRRRFKK